MKLLKLVAIAFISAAGTQAFASANSNDLLPDQNQAPTGDQYLVIEVLPEDTTFSPEQEAYFNAYGGFLPVMAEAYASRGGPSRVGGELLSAKVGNSFDGMASIYTDHRTASGIPFRSGALTCAHKTLPFGTKLLVSHGGRSVIVEVTDRGPYIKGRVLDLTPAAAHAIGISDNAGVGHVSAKIL